METKTTLKLIQAVSGILFLILLLFLFITIVKIYIFNNLDI